MARSSGVIISVKVPIKWEVMTKRTKQRLRQIVGRDTRAIHAFLGVIEQHEDSLLSGRHGLRIHDGELDKLTMTALRVRAGCSQRTEVPHDMKELFQRTSQNELAECRKTAVALYESYLRLRLKKGRKASRPGRTNNTRRIPRWVFSQRFRILQHRTSAANWWLDLRDSLDSAAEGRRIHDRLLIPLKMSPFHLNQIRRGDVKALQVFSDKRRKWWATFAVRLDTSEEDQPLLPVAVLGIDLGIQKAVCTALVTPTKVRETRYFVQRDKVARIRALDDSVARLQHEMYTRRDVGQPYDKVAKKLRKIRNKREIVAREYDRILVRQIVTYVEELSEDYTLHVAIGRLKNIRLVAKRGNFKGRRFRGMLHRWAFARFTDTLQHQLSQLGFPVDGTDSRFKVVPENWTSIMCWKCGHKGRRPKQNYFVCPTCGHKTNADRNGAINIAGRHIMLTKSLHSVRGPGKWADSVRRAGERSRPKARRKKPSRRKSLLSSEDQASDSGESAAVHHAQMSLVGFGDESNEGDKDPAVVRTVERLTAAESDTAASRQEKEARSVGGIPSQ